MSTQEVTTGETIRLDAVATAKEVRKFLKLAYPTTKYPGLKFSVTVKNSSLRIKWLNGPSRNAVEKLTSVFAGAELVQNGGDMIKGYAEDTVFNGKSYRFGTNYVFLDHEFDVPTMKIMVKYISDKHGYPLPQVQGDSEGVAWVNAGHEFSHFLNKLEREVDETEIPSLVYVHYDSASRITEAPLQIVESTIETTLQFEEVAVVTETLTIETIAEPQESVSDRWYDIQDIEDTIRCVWCPRVGVAIPDIEFKQKRGEYGHVETKDGRNWKLVLSPELLTMPKHLGLYIIVHELVHLANPQAKHNSLFKALMSCYYPNWKELDRELMGYAASEYIKKQIAKGTK